ncbi:hypothetical protein V9T40_013605 [Parthenolecanium corni]|uniref:Uncharacterized protein n=1 Tax=Parthenolecanium corni TaxID=536013 RepID=A0AAN9Y1I2_9HEMI
MNVHFPPSPSPSPRFSSRKIVLKKTSVNCEGSRLNSAPPHQKRKQKNSPVFFGPSPASTWAPGSNCECFAMGDCRNLRKDGDYVDGDDPKGRRLINIGCGYLSVTPFCVNM